MDSEQLYERYTIETEGFKGPLDLLLSLIEKRKLFINDISLAQVADDYVLHVKKMEQFPIALTAHFLLVASTLILIKSRSLLPSLSLTEEEVGDVEDLEKRLKEYQHISQLSLHIRECFGTARMFAKREAAQKEIVFAPGKHITLATMYAAMKDILLSLPVPEHLPKTFVRKVISLEEILDRLQERIKTGLRTSFKDFAGMGKEERVHIIISFLAMLELIKQGLIAVEQRSRFDDIHMETRELAVPHYT
ncbi:MAG: segregation and condensation protein A [Parcubacteria group bacterium Gr01-1014_48]|nr:MAG: segregation and condensation protein A [Parcubacteria group bacterium Greene0416_14]TSC74149.1 MAG: segregation and condensation protein A [Parcubacteria group bacterium Gr01-1014_48]TSD01694.1 MAG: segregation and condensation protein A [Parcubacteria group bacterium Greene1014_15]TSD08172.1 MAG: segregation and condensation protein A [Parcubacteria group bacterium Greene0714_4]